MLLAVNAGAVAIPLAFVVAVFTPANVPLAPLLGAVNVTVTPLTGLLLASLTMATSGLAKAAVTAALCGDPLDTVIEAGAPAVLVREKLTGDREPLVAVTL